MAFGNVAISVEIAGSSRNGSPRRDKACFVRQAAFALGCIRSLGRGGKTPFLHNVGKGGERLPPLPNAPFALLTLYRTPFQVNVVIISGGIMSEFVHGESEP
jgi:hypothetical protein